MVRLVLHSLSIVVGEWVGRKWESTAGVSEYIYVVCLTGAYMAVYCCVAAACVSLHSHGCQLLFYFKAPHEPESNTSCVPAYLRDAGKDASAFAAAQFSTLLGRLPGGVYRFSDTATARFCSSTGGCMQAFGRQRLGSGRWSE